MGLFKYFFNKKYRQRYYDDSIHNITYNIDEEDKMYLEINTPHKDIVVTKKHSG
ncbi:hypothetical protein [Clostridium sp. C8-1-8]|uniref:hypothetical protein n=1 Tax=Clostridium sp. C8-1-8 TaxID=2698831 RepID=UPI0013701D64|nr:hypothetical protein [Clostridium sp. C8-1-8]